MGKIKIYKITNSVTGDFYIGRTISALDQRMHVHNRKIKDGEHKLYQDMRKYGKSKFEIDLIKEVEFEDSNYEYMDLLETLRPAYNEQEIEKIDRVEKAKYLLVATNTTFTDIAAITNFSVSSISAINSGKMYWEDVEYPLREHRPADDKYMAVIKLLENSKLNNNQIAERVGIDPSTVSRINRCKRGTHLHKYKSNIRKGE